MRILAVNYEYPPLGGGAGNATAHIGRELAALGADVTVMTSAFSGLPKYESFDGLTIRRVPVIRRRPDRCTPPEMMTFLGSALTAALRLSKHIRPEVTLAFFGIPSGPVGLALKKRYGVPFVVSLRGGDVPGFQPYDLALYHRLLGWAIRSVWRRAEAVVANSTGLKMLAEASASDVPIRMIPNGVDTDRFRPLTENRNGGRVRLGFVGRLVYQKGLDVLLQALALLPVETDWRLEIVGDGDSRKHLETMAHDLDLYGKVHFAGWKERSELPGIYRQIDLFVLPSRDEGMPNVVLEAMASGLPVIASRVAGNEELVIEGQTGYLTPSEDPAALSRVLAESIGNTELRQQMGRAGRALVEARYTWRRVAEAYLELMARCIEDRDR